MNFVFISPNFPEAYWHFCACLAANGVTVLGVGDAPYEGLRPELKDALAEYYRVDSLEDYDQVYRAVAFFSFRFGKIDWIESNNEYWLEQDARLRTDFNVNTGLKAHEIEKYKSKLLMKRYYREAGVPAARCAPVTDLAGVLAFAKEAGYPLIVKPDSGVGATATYRLESDEEAALFMAEKPPVPYLMEEFVPGAVTTYDGICNSKGEVLFAASHVSPTSIMDMVNENRPCSYYVTARIPPEVEAAGRATLKAFGAASRFFHLEFFRLTADKKGLGKKGDIVALEVNMRPAGGFTPDMLNFSQSADVYQLWADMVAFDEARHTYDGPQSYCVYAGRRDGVDYALSQRQLEERYASNGRLFTRMPDALSGAMGNQVSICCFDTQEQVDGFLRDAFAEK